ncbi:hypothetical protein POVWA2_010620 [Plasmodium ovale wallikeri]|uniref:Uncharacterized protein n=1 Tax=Plasmodium ovale wallikeri TaxID=864142 RepID=A0A1A8YKN8_PLAOA|nr:hypothetical protein POVWA1_010480 [Plasmodium ovale wallikeri]SBT32639.1 hypothetical protein POVWA2_010620 [Plasmodium ovale wallikeri]
MAEQGENGRDFQITATNGLRVNTNCSLFSSFLIFSTMNSLAITHLYDFLSSILFEFSLFYIFISPFSGAYVGSAMTEIIPRSILT